MYQKVLPRLGFIMANYSVSHRRGALARLLLTAFAGETRGWAPFVTPAQGLCGLLVVPEVPGGLGREKRPATGLAQLSLVFFLCQTVIKLGA